MRERHFVCDVCHTGGTQAYHRGRPRVRHAHCALYVPVTPFHELPAFAPKSFDEAMERGREFWQAGFGGDDYPNNGYAVSDGDRATYNLGQRHAREFSNG